MLVHAVDLVAGMSCGPAGYHRPKQRERDEKRFRTHGPPPDPRRLCVTEPYAPTAWPLLRTSTDLIVSPDQTVPGGDCRITGRAVSDLVLRDAPRVLAGEAFDGGTRSERLHTFHGSGAAARLMADAEGEAYLTVGASVGADSGQVVGGHLRREELQHHGVLDPYFDDAEGAAVAADRSPALTLGHRPDVLLGPLH